LFRCYLLPETGSECQFVSLLACFRVSCGRQHACKSVPSVAALFLRRKENVPGYIRRYGLI
jgi:hypothetical protein